MIKKSHEQKFPCRFWELKNQILGAKGCTLPHANTMGDDAASMYL
jgi:hypothetical protein